jgi:hypothetical protein
MLIDFAHFIHKPIGMFLCKFIQAFARDDVHGSHHLIDKHFDFLSAPSSR